MVDNDISDTGATVGCHFSLVEAEEHKETVAWKTRFWVHNVK